MFAWSDRGFRTVRAFLPGGALGVTLLFLGASPALTQTAPERLYESCSSQAPLAVGVCGDGALAVQALGGGIGLLQTAGGAVPASPSTAGRRIATSPRVIVDGGFGWASFRAPDLSRAPGPTGVRGDQRLVLVGGRVTSAVGVFEGFSPVPTVGGILAVDAVGTAQFMWLPGSSGFSGSTIGWGAGVRLGVIRESFSLPGVTLTAMHYRSGTVRYGDLDADDVRASLRPSTTSFRAVVGRDLLTVGLVAGAGWDRYRGAGSIEVNLVPGSPGAGSTRVGPEDLGLTRRYLFVGANYTWLVTQVAGEVTWARTPFPLAEIPGTGPFRPGSREFQGAITVRITY